MKYLISKGTKIRRLRWTGAVETFVTTRDVLYSDRDVVALTQLDQGFIEFRIPLPVTETTIPINDPPMPVKKMSPYKSIKVIKDRIHFIAENESEERTMMNRGFTDCKSSASPVF